MLEQARLHLQRDEFAKARALLEELSSAAALPAAQLSAAMGDALDGLGDTDAAERAYRTGLAEAPTDPQLLSRIGTLLVRREKPIEALPFFERAEPALTRDPGFLTQYAWALLGAGRAEGAERAAARAMRSGGGPETRLVQGLIWAKRGQYAQAEEVAARLVSANVRPETRRAARAMLADARLFLGNALGALEVWRQLRDEGVLEPSQLGHFAYAAQLAGDPKLSDALSEERIAGTPTAEDLLLFAQIANLRGDPVRALELLARAEALSGAEHPAHGFEMLATRGRALRLQGRSTEAKGVLNDALAHAATAERLGAQVRVDLGHLAAEEGDFEVATRRFEEALEQDPADPEAIRGKELGARRVAWRSELAASAESKVEAAQAEAEAMRRRFAAREGEVAALRRELEKLKSAQRDAEEKARRDAELADRTRRAAVAQELLSREAEIEEKTEENIQRALGEAGGRCPPPLVTALRVAERTFQKALYMDLPAAAVAVLYAGVLERALYLFFVEPFQKWLQHSGRLPDFLRAATRERRGTRVEYFDHFVEAFDPDRPGRAPSMGEVGRVLQKRDEPYLAAFAEFLGATYALEGPFYEALGGFVIDAKEKLRDPVAHGRAVDMGYDELKRLREAMLFSFYGGAGLLQQVAKASAPR